LLAFTALGGFIQRLDALCAKVLPHHLSILKHPDVLNVRMEEALCPSLGVADVVAYFGFFAAVSTLRHDLPTLFTRCKSAWIVPY
jgi:hypothetical protein